MTHQSQQPLDEMNAFGPLTSTQGISHIKQAHLPLGGENNNSVIWKARVMTWTLHIMIRSILCAALHAEQ